MDCGKGTDDNTGAAGDAAVTGNKNAHGYRSFSIVWEKWGIRGGVLN